MNGVIRSGRYSYSPLYMRSAYRYSYYALSYLNTNVGFRSEWCLSWWELCKQGDVC